MDFGYESVSVDKSLLSPLNIEEYWYNSIPNCYTLLDSTGTNNDALNSAGILQVQRLSNTSADGRGSYDRISGYWNRLPEFGVSKY